MKPGTLFRLALTEVRNELRFTVLFCASLGLGLTGLTLLSSVEDTLSQSLSGKSRELLAADLSLSARRAFSESELDKVKAAVGSGAKVIRVLDLFSMVTSPGSAKLMQLTGIESVYPFYGKIRLAAGGDASTALKTQLQQEPIAWMDSTALVQLGSKPGDTVRIGDRDFKIGDRIVEDVGVGWRGFSLAPKVYVGISQLERTGLLGKKGNSVTERWLIQLPPALADGRALEALRKKLNQELPDPAIQIQTHRSASEQGARMIGFLTDYLGLVALVGLFLSSIGAAFLLRSHLQRRIPEVAILRSLGATPGNAVGVYLLQLSLLGIAASLLACGIVAVAAPALGLALKQALDLDLAPQLTREATLLTFAVGWWGSLLLCLPTALRILRIQTGSLFQESEWSSPSSERGPWPGFALVPAILAFTALVFWQAQSVRIGGAFLGGLTGALMALGVAGSVIFILLSRTSRGVRSLALRLALRNLLRGGMGSLLAFLSIGLGTALLTLVPWVQGSIEQDLGRPEAVPSVFLFDLQEDQLKPLEKFLGERDLRAESVSPWIRARLISVNGKPFEKKEENASSSVFTAREKEEETRLRNRGFNLTVRERLSESETIIRGEPYEPRAQNPELAEVSVEAAFARRLGLRLGDLLQFEVQGVEFSAKIVNLRTVRWTSFRPNFFVSVQGGVIDDAPKTWLAAITLPAQGRVSKEQLQTELVRAFPNVSVVDVEQVIQKLLGIFKQASWVLQWMAWLSLAAGALVTYSLAARQAALRAREVSLLKTLGADPKLISRMTAWEFGLNVSAAGGLGAALGLGLAAAVCEYGFEIPLSMERGWPVALSAALGVGVFSYLISQRAIARTLTASPLQLLG